MDDKKIIKIHNKSDKPDNIVFRDNVLIEKCIKAKNAGKNLEYEHRGRRN